MHVTIKTDGGSRGNPGPAAAGVVINDEHQRQLFAAGYYLGVTTNNVAEYQALLHALEAAQKLGATKLDIFTDSLLVARQINGQYRVKNTALRPLYQQVRQRIDNFEQVVVSHVGRAEIAQADALVNQALNMEANVGGIIAGTQNQPTQRARTAQTIQNGPRLP